MCLPICQNAEMRKAYEEDIKKRGGFKGCVSRGELPSSIRAPKDANSYIKSSKSKRFREIFESFLTRDGHDREFRNFLFYSGWKQKINGTFDNIDLSKQLESKGYVRTSKAEILYTYSPVLFKAIFFTYRYQTKENLLYGMDHVVSKKLAKAISNTFENSYWLEHDEYGRMACLNSRNNTINRKLIQSRIFSGELKRMRKIKEIIYKYMFSEINFQNPKKIRTCDLKEIKTKKMKVDGRTIKYKLPHEPSSIIKFIDALTDISKNFEKNGADSKPEALDFSALIRLMECQDGKMDAFILETIFNECKMQQKIPSILLEKTSKLFFERVLSTTIAKKEEYRQFIQNYQSGIYDSNKNDLVGWITHKTGWVAKVLCGDHSRNEIGNKDVEVAGICYNGGKLFNHDSAVIAANLRKNVIRMAVMDGLGKKPENGQMAQDLAKAFAEQKTIEKAISYAALFGHKTGKSVFSVAEIDAKGKATIWTCGDSGFAVISKDYTVKEFTVKKLKGFLEDLESASSSEKSEIKNKYFKGRHNVGDSYFGDKNKMPKENIVTITLEPGDILVGGSDGLWDNLTQYEVAGVIKESLENKIDNVDSVNVAVSALDQAYRKRFKQLSGSSSSSSESFFQKRKEDNITILVAIYDPQDSTSSTSSSQSTSDSYYYSSSSSTLSSENSEERSQTIYNKYLEDFDKAGKLDLLYIDEPDRRTKDYNKDEPGYTQAMKNAFEKFLKNGLFKKLDLDLIIEIHDTCVEGVKRENKDQKFFDLGTKKENVFSGGYHFGADEPTENAKKEWKTHRLIKSNKGMAPESEYLARLTKGGKFVETRWTKERVEEILERYYSKVAQEDQDDKKIREIVRCCRDLEISHIFGDGNQRTIVFVILNKLLMENDLSPVIMKKPSCFDGYFSVDELVRHVKRGMEEFYHSSNQLELLSTLSSENSA